MRRVTLVIVALAVLAAGCSVGGDRYLPKFGAAQRLVKAPKVTALAVGPSGAVYFALGAAVSVINPGSRPRAVAYFQAAGAVTGLATEADGSLLVASRGAMVQRVRGTESSIVWSADRAGAPHVAVSRNEVVIGLGKTIRSADDAVISDGWTDPVVLSGRGRAIWVADNVPGGKKELVARGREKDRPKRRRFATALPANTNPVGMALLDPALLVCSRAQRNVFRLHIGLDDVARRREPLKGVACSHGIAAAPDGSLITATHEAIYRYPPR